MHIRNLLWRIASKVNAAIRLWLRKDPLTGHRITPIAGLQRLGNRSADWVIPSHLITSDSVCYLAGAGEDISFDLALANIYKCQVHVFDPTPRAIAHFEGIENGNYDPTLYRNSSAVREDTLSKTRFHRLGLWDKKDTLRFFAPTDPDHVSHSILNLQKTDEYFEAGVNTVAAIMQELGHKSIDLLKIDIEGAEYKVIDCIIRDGVHIRILCVEFDEAFHALDDGYVARIKGSVGKLISEGYALVNVQHPANYTFVNKSVVSRSSRLFGCVTLTGPHR